MKRTTIVRLVLVIAAIAGAAMYVPVVEAQDLTMARPGSRGGNWEFILPLIYSESATVKGQNGSSVNLDADWGLGFGFGYNINDHFQLNGLFSWSSRSYNATVVKTDGTTQRYSNYMESSTIALNGVYYFLPGDVTPFVSGGVGITYIDTNIQNGPASGTCWYDPWWGYVCDTFVPTKTENDFSYNAGLGVRWDIDRKFSMQGSFNRMWIDFSKASGIPNFDMWRLDFIFRM